MAQPRRPRQDPTNRRDRPPACRRYRLTSRGLPRASRMIPGGLVPPSGTMPDPSASQRSCDRRLTVCRRRPPERGTREPGAALTPARRRRGERERGGDEQRRRASVPWNLRRRQRGRLPAGSRGGSPKNAPELAVMSRARHHERADRHPRVQALDVRNGHADPAARGARADGGQASVPWMPTSSTIPSQRT